MCFIVVVGLSSHNKQTANFQAQPSGIFYPVQKLPPLWQLSQRKCLLRNIVQDHRILKRVKHLWHCRKDLKSVKPDLALTLSTVPPPINLLHLQAGSSRCCNLCWGGSNYHNNSSSNVPIPHNSQFLTIPNSSHSIQTFFLCRHLRPYPPSRTIVCPYVSILIIDGPKNYMVSMLYLQ